MLPAQPRPIFISDAHADHEASDRKHRWLDRLREFLKPLVRQEELTICSDRDIKIGQDWHQHLQTHLQGAKAAMLLVSLAFLASDYIVNNELPVLLKNARDRGVQILPIILSPCLFEETRFKYPDPKQGPEEFTLASLQAGTLPSQTLIEMSEAEQNRVLLTLARRLLEIVKEHPPR